MQISLPHFIIGSINCCVYCGDPANVYDHLIPVSYQQLSRRRFYASRLGPKAWACNSCNQKLSNRLFDTFDLRCRFIRDWLNDQAKPIQWNQKEIAQLVDYKLKTFIHHQRSLRRWLRFRADWYESKDYLLNLESIQWQHGALHGPLTFYFAPTLYLIRSYYENWGLAAHKTARQKAPQTL